MKKIALSAGRLQHVFEALCQEGCQTAGTTIRDGAMVYDELSSIDDVPILKKCPGMPLSGVCACELDAILYPVGLGRCEKPMSETVGLFTTSQPTQRRLQWGDGVVF